MTQLLRSIPGLRVENRRNVGDIIVAGRGVLSVNNTSCDGVGVFIDGAEVAQPFEINQIVLSSLRAVEFYAGPAGVPPELRSAKVACGTLALWTK